MGPEERAKALKGEDKFGERVRQGYPLLQQQGERLMWAGVRYFDLTRVFAEVPEATYRDACCHVNARGQEIVGRAMGGRIVAALAAEPAGSRAQTR